MRPVRSLVLASPFLVATAACGSASAPGATPAATPAGSTPTGPSSQPSARAVAAPAAADLEACLAAPLTVEGPLAARRAVEPGTLQLVEAECGNRDPRTASPAECGFARGRAAFEAQDWVEAARRFRGVWQDFPGAPAALPAGMLYLEAINILAEHSRPVRIACRRVIVTDLEAVAAACDPRADAETCAEVESVRAKVRALGDPATWPTGGAETPPER